MLHNNKLQMNKFFVVFFVATLLVASNTLSLFNKQCTNGVIQLEKSFLSALKQDNQNKAIDQMTRVVETLPQVLQNCGAAKDAELFRSQVPPQCITDLNKASKLVVKAMQDTQNQVKFALDLAMLQRLFKTKLKKECPFLKDVTLEDIKSAAECLESSYQISKIFQAAWQDYKGDKKQKAMDEFTTGIELIPDTLTDCGHADLANKLRKFMTIQCVNSAERFVKEGIVFLHNFDKVEWVFNHAQDFLGALKDLEKNCS